MEYWPYHYSPEKSLDVLKQTETYFLENPDTKKRIEELGWIYHTIGMIIPQTYENFWSGHFFPFTDSWEELQVSFNLICFGFYKQAFVSLRSGLELGLLSVYYNINDDGHNEVKAWLNSKDERESNTPRSDKVWKILLSNENIKAFDEKHNLKNTFDNLGYLHNYVHTKGAKFSNRMGLFKQNSQSFEKQIIDKWLDSYANIISLIATLHLLKYPLAVVRFDYSKKFGIDIPSFGNLEVDKIEKIAKILPMDFLKDIEEIAANDDAVQQIIAEVSAMPDKTDEQVEEQIIELEKRFIEGMGFTAWLVKQKEIYQMLDEDISSIKKRIEILEKWAIENNFIEPVEIRLGLNIKK